jgi:hypothetical protein
VQICHRVVVYSPQLIENYTLQSGEGLSTLFVIIWLLGDMTNLLGALLGGLLPTVIILGLYVSPQTLLIMDAPIICLFEYTACDATLLFQIYYYRWKRSRLGSDSQDRETDPLLGCDEITEEVLPVRDLALRYSAALIFVIAVGLMAWWITYDDEPGTDLAPPVMDEKKWWLVQALGWSSALLFVCLQDLALLPCLISDIAGCTSPSDM